MPIYKGWRLAALAVQAQAELAERERPLTADELASWLTARGVAEGSEYLAELMRDYAGKTLDEMDAIYDELHSW